MPAPCRSGEAHPSHHHKNRQCVMHQDGASSMRSAAARRRFLELKTCTTAEARRASQGTICAALARICKRRTTKSHCSCKEDKAKLHQNVAVRSRWLQKGPEKTIAIPTPTQPHRVPECAAVETPISFNFPCALRASSVPGNLRTTSRKSRIPLDFAPSAISANPFFSNEAPCL